MLEYSEINIYKTSNNSKKYIDGKKYLLKHPDINSCLNSNDLNCINTFKEKDIINKLMNEINNSDIVEKKYSTLENGILRYDSPIYINDKDEFYWRTYIILENGNILYYKMDLLIISLLDK